MEATLKQVLYCFCVLSAFLLLGSLLRAKVPLFRKLFLPASVIGGFLALLLGPILWGETAVPHIPFPSDWVEIWKELPGILIIPVVASVPLGMKRAKRKPGEPKQKTSSNALKMFAIISGVTVLQGVIGLFTQLIYNGVGNMGLYATFGYELPSGFTGGHGTAGIIGGLLKDLGQGYWEIAQDVTTTTATFGLVGGMIIGIAAINILARKGKTAILDKPGDIPDELAKGFQLDKNKQKSTGRETTFNSSIESLGFHLCVILVGCGIAFGVVAVIKWLGIPGLANIPVWAYAILVMFAVNGIIQKLHLGALIDSKTKTRISGVCSDYAITAAIASLNVKTIMHYFAPIMTMIILGFVVTYFIVRFLCNKFFDDYHVERSMACFGTCSGIFLTGMMLLKICDPEFKSPVLNDYSVGYSFNSVVFFLLTTLFFSLMLKYHVAINILIQFGVFLLFVVLIIITDKASKAPAKE